MAVEQEVAFAHRFEAGDHPQQCRFAAARRTDENHEFSVLNGEVDAVNHGARAVTLDDTFELEAGHVNARYLIPDEAMPVVM